MKFMLALLVSALVSPMVFAQIDRELAVCAIKEGDLARLECYDDIAEKNGLAGPQTEPLDVTDNGKWRVSSKTNPINDSKTVTLFLQADSGQSNWGDPVTLIIRCMSNQTELYISWNDYLGSSASVLTRVGSNQAQTKSWGLSTDSKATFHPRGTIDFIKSMMQSPKLVTQTTPYNVSPVTAIFDTSGLSTAIKPLRETCAW